MIIKSIAVVVLALMGVSLSFWVILSDKKSLSNRFLFSLINLSMLFIIFDHISIFTGGDLTTYLLRLTYALAPIAAMFFYLFVLYFPFRSKKISILESPIIFSSIIIFFVTLFSNLVVSSAVAVNGLTVVVTGDLIIFYYVVLVYTLGLTLIDVIKKYFISKNIDKMKIKLLLLGIIAFIFSEIVFNIFLPIINIENLYYLGDYSIIIFFGLTAYAIVRHHLFDIKFAVVRSVTYSLLLITLACVYIAIMQILSAMLNGELASTGQIASGVVISLLLAFAFQPLKRFFDKITNKFFYKDNYNNYDFFDRLNGALTVTTDLRGLLERAAYEIGNTLKSEQAFFFINTIDGHYVSAGTLHHRHLPKDDAIKIEELCPDSGVVTALTLEASDPLRRLMSSHRIQIVLPLAQSNNIIGYLCLGDRLTSDYSNRDIKTLKTISDELVIAIQNALAVQEIREINATLQQRIANATKELRSSNAVLRQLDRAKDEFVSMASHQLRTPLTSVKGYVSMVLEGDAGDISDTQRQFLNEAYASSERMVHLIDDFLNVSRIQNGKFIVDKHPTDLSKVVEQEIDSLQPSAISRNLKFAYKQPKNFPILDIDEGKIRQVIMNFADNALYYAHENTTININLVVEGNGIIFTVKDSGIGVPLDEQDQLFSKFYRASNAKKQRPDGTGVGLYLAKKIIDVHGGKIVFESEVGKGSTFGFRLPIK